MKFLGIRNGHDQNLCYTDGTKVVYCKLERNLQLKHHLWHLHSVENFKDDVPDLLAYAKDKMEIDFSTLDGVCINPSSDYHEVPIPARWENSRQIDPKNDNNELDLFWTETFSCPVHILDHHYAHVLSCWPLWEEKPLINFVFDGIGDHCRHTSVFRNDKLVEFITNKEATPGLSLMLEFWAEKLEMQGITLDLSGKMMAKAAYHDVPPEIIDTLMKRMNSLGYRHFLNIKEECDAFADYFRADERGFINSAYVLQEFCKRKIPELIGLHLPGYDSDWHKHEFTYSGGTAQNTVVNTSVKNDFPGVIIPPHCPDDGISLGCVEYLRTIYGGEPFDKTGFPFWQSDEAPLEGPSKYTIWRAAEALALGKRVGWYQGHGEIGPRALGNRSILMDPTVKNGKEIINRVKKREPYRPFGASVLKEHTSKLFDFEYDSPFMLFVTDIKSNDYPSVTHVDGTCRIQTVDGNDPVFEDYHFLISAFQRLTGVPMLLNTSLNVDGKPIAAHIMNAANLFENSELDMLVVGDDVTER